ncbi:MAG: hypothetical protein K6E49_09060 [Lachnospiraceae bacterium]|nr:hypothetical protein [Lachnospiraceae bacterium]
MKKIQGVWIFMISAMLLTGCAGVNAGSDLPDIPEKIEDTTLSDAPEQTEDITFHITGEWTLFDRDTGSDYGTLTIKEDGSFEFTRLSDNATGKGTVSFEYRRSEDDETDGFRMDFDDCKDLLPKGVELYGDEGTSGIFHVGTFGNEDYLYLKEIGNGDSIVSVYVFNTKDNYEDIGGWSYDWLFYRDNDMENPAKIIKDDTFYAWAWETDEDGVWLQPMTEHTKETVEEYTDWRYLGAHFNETDNIGIAHYGITADTDLTGIANTRDWDSGYPLMMCEVTVDSDGNVKKLTDVDIVMYDSYYMGDIKPEFSYKDTVFTINCYETDITPFAPGATAIVDARQVGEWIIIECHNNPDISTYLFYNIPDGFIDQFEYEIRGANLIWQGDDLSTSVYQQYNSIYDIWGHMIGSIQEGQLYELSFKDRNTIAAKCWIVDENGREKEFTEEFEYEPCDGAVWAYFEYLLGGNKQWRRLKEMAGDASALIIVNPPERIRDRMPYPITVTEGALDKVATVPLFDDSKISIRSNTEKPEKGRAAVFEVTVPEGMPIDTITVEAPGHKKAEWKVGQLSGRNPQMSTFIR